MSPPTAGLHPNIVGGESDVDWNQNEANDVEYEQAVGLSATLTLAPTLSTNWTKAQCQTSDYEPCS